MTPNHPAVTVYYDKFQNYDNCTYKFSYCTWNSSNGESQQPGACLTHQGSTYSDASAAWIMIAAIIVFFMKAGFMLLESAFASEPGDRRNVIIIKHIDAFASALGFFLVGCDWITDYLPNFPVKQQFFSVQQPLLWFFKFTFASNAATLIGGCLVNFEYKLRLPAAFISAFVISGIVHPAVARLIWAGHCHTLSPFRYCTYPWLNKTDTCEDSMLGSYYILDFAGGGAVHLLGGVAGLMVCLFAKYNKWWHDRQQKNGEVIEVYEVHKWWSCRRRSGEAQETLNRRGSATDSETPKVVPKNFPDWMYSVNTDENIEHAALGVLILWFAWFAFNCGSTENIQGGKQGYWHSVPSRIAVNMIICCASGGTLAVLVASWMQLRIRTDSLNANEIANGVLSCLVAITASCPYVTYWQACIIGILAILVYHFACYLEYRCGIPDTARVVPVHGACGLLSIMSASFAAMTIQNQCYLHATYEGVVSCQLILPHIGFASLFAMQLLGAIVIIAAGVSMAVVYGVLYMIPMQPFAYILVRVFCIKGCGCQSNRKIKFHGGWLFTDPREEKTVYGKQQDIHDMLARLNDSDAPSSAVPILERNPSHHAGPRKRVSREIQRYASRDPSYGSMMRRSGGEEEVPASQGDVVTISTRGSLNPTGIDDGSDPSL